MSPVYAEAFVPLAHTCALECGDVVGREGVKPTRQKL